LPGVCAPKQKGAEKPVTQNTVRRAFLSECDGIFFAVKVILRFFDQLYLLAYCKRLSAEAVVESGQCNIVLHLYFSSGNMHSRLDSSEQIMKEITKGLQRGKKFFPEFSCASISLTKTL
jgi:hypothetical protein